jgi:hypothetical protein
MGGSELLLRKIDHCRLSFEHEQPHTARWKRGIVPSVAWAWPLSGGSHGKLHRSAKIFSYTWRLGGRLAARRARPAAGNAGGRLPQQHIARGVGIIEFVTFPRGWRFFSGAYDAQLVLEGLHVTIALRYPRLLQNYPHPRAGQSRSTEKAESPRGTVVAERRHVTVLFADMVGFTVFSERSGEEAAYELMRPLYDLMNLQPENNCVYPLHVWFLLQEKGDLSGTNGKQYFRWWSNSGT